MTKAELIIDHIGARGDGVANDASLGAIYAPFTLPKEKISAKVSQQRVDSIEILEPSPARIAPVCQHYGRCGGCVMQHANEETYLEWKLEIVNSALRKAGIDFQASHIEACELGARRRVVLTAKKTNEGTELGYFQAASKQLIAIKECPVATDKITQHLEHFLEIAKILTPHGKPAQLTITALDDGIDVAVSGEYKIAENDIQAVIKRVIAGKVIKRLSFNDEALVETQSMSKVFGGVAVLPPAGSFLQASQHAEDVMVNLVSKHLKGAKKIADLFSGCGTFTFPLSKRSQVHAVETSGAALNAIDDAFRTQQGLKPVTTERRDLFRRPLMRHELKHFQGVVFDPPRAGAEAQCKQIARSTVSKVAAVSCNPTTLARDLSLLTKSGYVIKLITAIDQFLFSHHVEVVALLERK